MSAPDSSDDAPSSARRAGLRALPWIVGLSTVIALLPLGIFARPETAGLLLAEAMLHSPTFLVLFALSLGIAGRARREARVSAALVGAIAGALLGATGLMLGILVLAFVLRDWWVLLLYFFQTPFFLPLAGLAGAGLGAGIVALVRLSRQRRCRSVTLARGARH